MSDPTPNKPHDDDTTPIGAASPTPSPVPGPAASDAPAPSPSEPVAVHSPAPAAPRNRWYGRRVPLLATGAALILGCLLGGGIVAVGALIVDGHHGDERGHHSRMEGPDRRGNEHGDRPFDGWRNGGGRDGNGRPGPNMPPPANGSVPSAPAPVPSASS